MIRIVTGKRHAMLEADAHAASERARQADEAASEAVGRHERELADATDRAERAEATLNEVGALLAHAVKEVSGAEQGHCCIRSRRGGCVRSWTRLGSRDARCSCCCTTAPRA